MEFENFVNGNSNLFKDEDDEILLNPIHFINKFESQNDNKNSNINTLTQQMPLDIQNNKNNMSINSTLNTNAALDESSQNINFNLSFISFNNDKNQEKKELTQQSIEALTEIISKEKMLVENNNIIEEDKKLLKIKELKNNLEKIDEILFKYFKRPYMRKNIKIIKKVENDDDSKEEEEKKIDFDDEIEEKDKNFKINNITENFGINNYINEI